MKTTIALFAFFFASAAYAGNGYVCSNTYDAASGAWVGDCTRVGHSAGDSDQGQPVPLPNGTLVSNNDTAA